MEEKLFNKKRILVAPEMANLAETHRMVSFAEAFELLGHEVFVLGRGRFDYLFTDKGLKRVYIEFDDEWMNDERFKIMHNFDEVGLDFISEEDLEKFVRFEVELLEKLKPDVVITGFRPTMSISTKISKIPLVWVLSAVCSDMYYEKKLAMPFMMLYQQVPILKIMPEMIRKALFARSTLNYPHKINVWNAVMKKHNLGTFRNTLKLLRGDYNIMSDASELFPEFGELEPYYSFCGPLLMESKIDMPQSVRDYKKKKGTPLVFFAMGSSGNPEIFKSIIASFDSQKFDVFVACTNILNKEDIPFIPSNVIVEKMYPAFEITAMADVAVIHGGQGTVYTTVMAGTPFVGIPMFGEQQHNLESLQKKGCGIVISKYSLNPRKLNNAIRKILNNKRYKERVMSIQKQIIKYKTDRTLNPAMVGAKNVIEFLKNPQNSYFDLKGE